MFFFIRLDCASNYLQIKRFFLIPVTIRPYITTVMENNFEVNKEMRNFFQGFIISNLPAGRQGSLFGD